jgi:hypothetical protein
MVAAELTDFLQQIVSGLASGGVYALLALALVIIHRSTGVINFAQGEMATLSTYLAWALIAHHSWSYWPAFAATLVISFVGGIGIHTAVIRPVERGSVLRIVIVTIGLLVAINGFVVWQWSGEPQQLQSPFGTEVYTTSGRSPSRSGSCCSCGGSSSSRSSGSRCAPRPSIPRRRGSSACASRGCSGWAGASRRSSAPSPACSPRRRSASTRT